MCSRVVSRIIQHGDSVSWLSIGDGYHNIIQVERGAAVYLSGLREKYFGEVFLNASKRIGGLPSAGALSSILKESRLGINDVIETDESMVHGIGNSWSSENMIQDKFRPWRGFYEEGLNHIAIFVESFESRANEIWLVLRYEGKIWLVFRYEGKSLSKLVYTLEEVDENFSEERAEDEKTAKMLHPSKWWRWLKTTEAGREEMRSLIWQLGYQTWRIIDFGSALDEYTLEHLYSSTGPSRAEQTNEYTPPLALLNASWHQAPVSRNLKYDMWSAGVVILELILGSPNVFQISAYTRSLLDQHLEG